MDSELSTALEVAWCAELGVSEAAPDQNFPTLAVTLYPPSG
ncbi:hypothetical protein ACIBSS_33065 [Micromonospora aurantiaca]|nr:hypothetical protein [Micromonospora aurantiaca]